MPFQHYPIEFGPWCRGCDCCGCGGYDDWIDSGEVFDSFHDANGEAGGATRRWPSAWRTRWRWSTSDSMSAAETDKTRGHKLVFETFRPC